MKNLVQRGENIIITASGSDINAGDLVIVGALACVAANDIADGYTGPAATQGVYELPKDNTVAISQGQKVYWSAANSNVTNVDTGNTLIGVAFEAAAQAATTVNVLINVAT